MCSPLTLPNDDADYLAAMYAQAEYVTAEELTIERIITQEAVESYITTSTPLFTDFEQDVFDAERECIKHHVIQTVTPVVIAIMLRCDIDDVQCAINMIEAKMLYYEMVYQSMPPRIHPNRFKHYFRRFRR